MNASRTIAALVLAAGAVSLAAQPQPPGQQTSPTQGVVKKGKVPVSNEILKIRLPKPVEVDLPNGLHLMVLEDHRLPQISFQLIVPGAGGYYDPAEQPGLASFVAALMREGTASRTSEQLSQQLEVMAATLTVNAGTGLESTVSGSCLSDQFDKLLDISADVVLRPTFPDSELASYKQRTRAQLTQQRANPGFLAAELFGRVVYGTHPASRLSPTVASLDAATRDALSAFHRAHYVPDHAAHRDRRRHLASRGAEAGRGQAGRLDEIGRSSARRDRSGGAERAGDRLHRAAEFCADEPDRRHAGDRAHESGLRRAAGDEQDHRRRTDRHACSSTFVRRRATPTVPAAR